MVRGYKYANLKLPINILTLIKEIRKVGLFQKSVNKSQYDLNPFHFKKVRFVPPGINKIVSDESM